MAKVIVMPKMGEAMEEGQITEWLVKEGTRDTMTLSRKAV